MRPSRSIAALFVAVCAVLVAAGCSNDDPTTAAGQSPAGSIDPNATGTGVQATPPPLTEEDRNFGTIKAVDTSARTITFDLGGFVEGKRAQRAAVDDGAIKKGEKLDTDFYIRNKVKFDRSVPLAEDVKIRVVGNPPDLVDGDIDDFAASFESDEIPAFADDGSATYRGASGKYWITVKDGEVTLIEEQYIP